MPTWIEDPLSGRWIVQAPDRSRRPRAHGADATCPFCPGGENQTPPEVDRVERDGNWQVRVFPNLYPAVAAARGPDVGAPPAGGLDGKVGAPASGAPVTGAHEVVVLSPGHDDALADLDDTAARAAVGMLLRRARGHQAAGRAYAQTFVNHGAAAGASIAHPHGQVVALDVVPPRILRERVVLERDECPICMLAAPDVEVVEAHGLVAVCPPWSVTPFELLVAPCDHGAELGADVGIVLADVLRRLRGAAGDVAYNLVFHPDWSAPGPSGGLGHPHVHVYPRIELDAGFELGTGLALNSASPSVTAGRLRAAG